MVQATRLDPNRMAPIPREPRRGLARRTDWRARARDAPGDESPGHTTPPTNAPHALAERAQCRRITPIPLLMPHALLLTGTCGSGKSTIAAAIGEWPGWVRFCEDDAWSRLFGRNRGGLGTARHRTKRAAVHEAIFAEIATACAAGLNVVIDATVHESPLIRSGSIRASSPLAKSPGLSGCCIPDSRSRSPAMPSALAGMPGRQEWRACEPSSAAVRFPPTRSLTRRTRLPNGRSPGFAAPVWSNPDVALYGRAGTLTRKTRPRGNAQSLGRPSDSWRR